MNKKKDSGKNGGVQYVKGSQGECQKLIERLDTIFKK